MLLKCIAKCLDFSVVNLPAKLEGSPLDRGKFQIKSNVYPKQNPGNVAAYFVSWRPSDLVSLITQVDDAEGIHHSSGIRLQVIQPVQQEPAAQPAVANTRGHLFTGTERLHPSQGDDWQVYLQLSGLACLSAVIHAYEIPALASKQRITLVKYSVLTVKNGGTLSVSNILDCI